MEQARKAERRDALANRQRLLEVAKALFAEQGAAHTTMKQLAEAAAVGKGTLYRNFPDKGELCRALIREDLAAFQARVGAMIADQRRTPSALARLEILIAERISLTETHLPLFAAIEAASAGGPQQVKGTRGPFGAWTHAQIVRLLDEAVAQGETAPLDTAFVADAILAALSPAQFSYQRQECGYSIDRISAGVRRLFIDGLRRPVTPPL
jgi:AcrR family transcriptional regulator